jgi:hypothetical protein
VQKSNFGEQYFINLGVLVKGLIENDEDKFPPKENHCHIRLRIEALKPNEDGHLKQLFDLEDGAVSPAERLRGVEEAIKRIALPFLILCSTLAGIRDAEDRGLLGPAVVHRSIRDSVLKQSR